MWLDLSAQLRRGLDEVRVQLEGCEFQAARREEPALAELTLNELLEFVHRPSHLFSRQDAVWLAVMHRYRRGPARIWAPLLLEMLAPALVVTASRIAQAWPHVDAADVQQQLVVEALASAASLRLEGGRRWVQRLLIHESERRVRRWLQRTGRRREEELDDTVAVADQDARREVSELLASGPSSDDLELVVRVGLCGEDLGALAAEAGISRNAMKCSYWRARRRLQDLIPPDGPPRNRRITPVITKDGRRAA